MSLTYRSLPNVQAAQSVKLNRKVFQWSRKVIQVNRKVFLLITIFLLMAGGIAFAFQSRLSCAVAIAWKGAQLELFLRKPGVSYIETYFLIKPDFPSDVIFGVDQEFIEGVNAPIYIKGGDWMSLVGLQRNGTIWVAEGTEDTMRGKPSKDRKWKILSLGENFRPDTWYRIRCYSDFATRTYQRLFISGPGLDKSFDLTGVKLDYPNYMPFDERAMSYYTFAMRSRTMMKAGESGEARAYFDDMKGGVVINGVDQPVFASDFESQQKVDSQPLTLPVIKLAGYQQNHLYKERDEAKYYIIDVPFARSGRRVGTADAGL